MTDEFEMEMNAVRVNVVVRGIALGDAKRLIEGHFGRLDWPAASFGKTQVSVANNVSITIETGGG